MKCPIKGVSKDCENCDGESTIWIEDGEVKECVFVIVWKERQKHKQQKTSPYQPLVETNMKEEKEAV